MHSSCSAQCGFYFAFCQATGRHLCWAFAASHWSHLWLTQVYLPKIDIFKSQISDRANHPVVMMGCPPKCHHYLGEKMLKLLLNQSISICMLYKCVALTSGRKKTAAAEKIRRVARFYNGWQINLFFCCVMGHMMNLSYKCKMLTCAPIFPGNKHDNTNEITSQYNSDWLTWN